MNRLIISIVWKQYKRWETGLKLNFCKLQLRWIHYTYDHIKSSSDYLYDKLFQYHENDKQLCKIKYWSINHKNVICLIPHLVKNMSMKNQ